MYPYESKMYGGLTTITHGQKPSSRENPEKYLEKRSGNTYIDHVQLGVGEGLWDLLSSHLDKALVKSSPSATLSTLYLLSICLCIK